MDVLSDLLRLIADHVGQDVITQAQIEQIERAARARHGGRAHHISAHTQAEQIARIRDQRRRDDAIRAAIAAGCTRDELQTRFGLTRQQIWNIARKGW